VAKLRFGATTFDRIITLNCLYYWPDPMAGLRELARVLKPEGRVAAGIHTPEHLRPMTRKWEGFILYTPTELADRMQTVGFKGVGIEQRGHAVVVVGQGR